MGNWKKYGKNMGNWKKYGKIMGNALKMPKNALKCFKMLSKMLCNASKSSYVLKI